MARYAIVEKNKRHRTATTVYPCFLPDLGELTGAGRAARYKGKYFVNGNKLSLGDFK